MSDAPAWTPTVDEVAARILSRTKTALGGYVGTFNTETKPTASQVNLIITQAVSLMTYRLGEIAERLQGQARALTSLRAAYMVELAFFPEQVETNISPYNALRMEFKEELANWDMVAKGLEPSSQSQIFSLHVGTEYPGYATQTF